MESPACLPASVCLSVILLSICHSSACLSFVCLSFFVCLDKYLVVSLPASLPECQPSFLLTGCLSVSLSMSVRHYVFLSVCVSLNVSVFLSVCLSVCEMATGVLRKRHRRKKSQANMCISCLTFKWPFTSLSVTTGHTLWPSAADTDREDDPLETKGSDRVNCPLYYPILTALHELEFILMLKNKSLIGFCYHLMRQ